jgi:hypothetical protein
MSNPFKLTDLPNNTWLVTWAENNFVHNARQRDKLVDIVFRDIGCREVGLGITLNSGELETLWISDREYYQRFTMTYGWEDMYVVGGIVFLWEQEARAFYHLLESRLAWYYLKQSEAV